MHFSSADQGGPIVSTISRAAMTLLVTALATAPRRPQDEKRPVTVTGDIGFVNTAGNTHLTSLMVGDRVTVQTGKVLLTQTALFVNGRSECTETANNLFVRGRAQCPLRAKLSVYGFAGYERNRFAGLDRCTDEGVGLSLAAWRDELDQLDFDAGVGLT